MSFTNYLENKVLDHVFGGGDFTRPATIQIGLSTTEIEEDGTGITEPQAADGYARVSLDNDGDTWENAETSEAGEWEGHGTKVNKIEIVFPEATGGWGEVTHFFVADGTNILGYGELEVPRTVLEGQEVRFEEQALQVTLD